MATASANTATAKRIKMRCARMTHGIPCLKTQTMEILQDTGGQTTFILSCVHGHETYFDIGEIGRQSKLQEWLNQGEVL